MTDTHTLYICYFGMREPLVQTQVIPYLREILKDKIKVSLLTFEPDLDRNWTAQQIEKEKEKLSDQGIEWHCLPYHKRPSVPATLYDIFSGARFIMNLMRRERIDVLHARVHIPAIMGAIAKKFSRRKPKLVFDIRGFIPEEYTEAGVWKENGRIYKTFKRIEKWLFRESDAFVVLTEKAREILFPESAKTGFDKHGRPVEVIPCCVDFERRFQDDRNRSREKIREKLNLDDRLVITHLGALGGLYLTREIADFLKTAKDINPDVYALFLTQSNPELIIPLLKERGFSEEDYFVGKVSPADVQSYLNAADIALSFVKSGYATLSRSPTKIPEYLACGLPIVSNSGVGDVDELIQKDKIGVIINEFNPESYRDALDKISGLKHETETAERCRNSAESRFDLENIGGKRYRRLYNKIIR